MSTLLNANQNLRIYNNIICSGVFPNISKNNLRIITLNIILILNHVRPGYFPSISIHLSDILEYLPNNMTLYNIDDDSIFTLRGNIEELDEYFKVYKYPYALGKSLGYPYIGSKSLSVYTNRYRVMFMVKTKLWTLTLYSFMIPADEYNAYEDDINILRDKIADVLEPMGRRGFDENGEFDMNLQVYVLKKVMPIYRR